MTTTSVTEKDHGYEPSAVRDNSTDASNFTSFVFSESHYNLPIPLRFAFGIGVSAIKKWPSDTSSVRYARAQESSK